MCNSDAADPKTREPISAFVICYNEEDNIGPCLETLGFCDEVVVVDSFSTDRTVEIAESYGAKVIRREWSGFREQKAFGLARTSNEWVLNVDADERVSDELRESIEGALRRPARLSEKGARDDEGPSGYYINRVVYFLGRWWRRGGWYPEYRLRLLKKSKTVWGGVNPHEKAIVSGKKARLGGELLHYSYRDMDDQFGKLHSYSTLAAHQAHKTGKRAGIFRLFLNPLCRFLQFFIFKRGYREGKAGLVMALTMACYTFMKYAKLWELKVLENSEKTGKGS